MAKYLQLKLARDYLGAFVQLRREVKVDGRTYDKGAQFVVSSVWRGRLTLEEREPGTLARGDGIVRIRHLRRDYVDVIMEKLA